MRRNLSLPSILFALVAVTVAATTAYATEPARGPLARMHGKGTAPAKAQPNSKIEARAIEILQAMSKRLAAARTLAFTAVTTYESPSWLGPPLAYATESHVTLARPDKLRVLTLGDGPASEFYYDGHSMTAYEPAANLAAVAEAPSSIDAALKAAYDEAALYFPFTDVVVADPYKDLAEGLRRAFVMGQSRVVGGTTTDIVVVVNDQVFAQIWIGAADKLPRRVRAVFARDPLRLRHDLEFEDWRLNDAIPADAFRSARAAAAKRVEFARPEPAAEKQAAGVSGAHAAGKSGDRAGVKK